MIDPATGWFEIAPIINKTPFEVASKVEVTWMTRYPWPTQIIFDKGKEFMGEFARMCREDYGIKTRPITTRNPQANAVIERVHKTLGNMIRTKQVQESTEKDPWTGVLAAVSFATRATYHTTLQATPAQLVFGRDSILNIMHEANWKYIKARKQDIIDQNNERENSRRVPYDYHVGDKVLMRTEQKTKYGTNPYEGPHKIVSINDNGTVRVEKKLSNGSVQQTWNIRNLKPYRD